jgi:lipoic acid synthetase
VAAVRRISPGTTMETLIPDFAGKWENLQLIIDAAPEIVSHNLETVRRLTKEVRIQAKYDRSLEVLLRLKQGGMRTKSGVMLGLGESEQEVIETMDDLRSVGVDILTLGQYLQPTLKHLPVKEFITPEKFAEYKELGLAKGFRYVESGPLVRSSYHAEKHIFEL